MTSPALDKYLTNPDRVRLAEKIKPLFALTSSEDVSDGRFSELAMEVYQYQFNSCEPFRRLCLGLGARHDVRDWRKIPGVPTDAFRHYRITCFNPALGEIEFHTSGTSHGKSGVHWIPGAELYDGAAIPWFALHLLPELASSGFAKFPIRVLSLTASPAEAVHSSLVHMIRATTASCCDPDEAAYFIRRGELDVAALNADVEKSVAEGRPVLLHTTAFSLVHWLEALERENRTLNLPEGSRMMETGGYKGRSRRVDKRELYLWASRRLGLPVRVIVNEYGMTEMSSQFYDRTLREDSMDEDEARIKIPPPWVRSLVIDPVSRKPVEDGATGVLRHIDLANLDSCAFILTADAARRHGNGFELLGRLSDVELRGCSLEYEDLRT